MTPGDSPRKCHSLVPALPWNFQSGEGNLAGSSTSIRAPRRNDTSFSSKGIPIQESPSFQSAVGFGVHSFTTGILPTWRPALNPGVHSLQSGVRMIQLVFYFEGSWDVLCHSEHHWLYHGQRTAKLMLLRQGKIKGKRRSEQQRMRGLHSTTDSMDMSLNKAREIVKDRGAWCAAVHRVAKSRTRLSDWTATTLNKLSMIGSTGRDFKSTLITGLCIVLTTGHNYFLYYPVVRVLEKQMANHSSVLAWRIPGTGEPGGRPSMGSHSFRHDWSDLAAAAAAVRVLQGAYCTFLFLNGLFFQLELFLN